MSVFRNNHDGTETETYAGCVLGLGSKGYVGDSDFYAIVWDEEAQAVVTALYETTRCAADGRAVVDATPEVIAKAKEWLKDWAAKALTVGYKTKATEELYNIDKGTVVRVFKGRKVPIGTVGTVFWKGEKHYGVSYRNTGFYRGTSRFYGDIVTRIGFNDAEGNTFWTNIENVEKADKTLIMPAEAEIEAQAQAMADRGLFHLPFVAYGPSHDVTRAVNLGIQAVV
jgi:hypothetical protein